MDDNSGNGGEINGARQLSFAEQTGIISPTPKPKPAKPVAPAPTPQAVHPNPDKNRFKALRDAGYQPLPVVPPGAPLWERSSLSVRMRNGKGDGRGKAPGVKGFDGLWRGLGDWVQHEATDEDVIHWHEMGASIGVKAGPQPEGTWLALIDTDVLNETHAKQTEDEIYRRFGVVPTRVGLAPKALYVIRLNGPLPYTSLSFGDGKDKIEVLTTGRQAVFWGIHPKTGERYQWPQELVPYNELPVRSVQEIVDLLVALKEILPDAEPIFTEGGGNGADVDQESLKCSEAEYFEVLANMRNLEKYFPDRPAFVTALCAMKAASAGFPEKGLEGAQQWAADTDWIGDDGDGNDPAVVEEIWHSLHGPFRIGRGYLYRKAEEVSGGKFSRANQWFDADAVNDNRATAAADDDDWPEEPLDIFGHTDPENLGTPPTSSLPPILERVARSEAALKGVSIAFTASALVTALAGAVGASLKIQSNPKDTTYREPACLWMTLTGRSGIGKSPVNKRALEALKKLDAEWRRADVPRLEAWEAEVKRSRGKNADLLRSRPKVRRKTVDDITFEKQIRIHADNPHGLIRAPDELVGFLESFGAYKKGGGGDRSNMLRLFDGDDITADRVGSGTTAAESALMSLLSGTQPEKLRTLVKDLGTDGMLQRMLFVLDDGVQRERLQGVEPDHNALGEYDRVISGLASVGYQGSRTVQLSPEAYEVIENFRKTRLKPLQHDPGASDALAGHLSKWHKIVVRIVLVFHAFELFELLDGVDPDVKVSRQTAEMAVKFSEFLLRHSLTFYNEYFGVSATGKEARDIAGYLLTHPEVNEPIRRDIYHARPNFKGAHKQNALRAAMRELEGVGWLKTKVRSPEGAEQWRVNPHVHTRYKDHADRERIERPIRQERIIEGRKAAAALLRGEKP